MKCVYAKPLFIGVVALIATLPCWVVPARAVVLFEEDFEGLTLGPVVTFPSEVTAFEAWTSTPPQNWSSDASGVPGDPINEGVREFRGWTFVDKEWWTATSGDQDRSLYTLGHGTVGVADPDEFDDFSLGSGEGRGPAPDGCADLPNECYSCGLITPPIPLNGVGAGQARVVFDSSWRPEDGQKGAIQVSYGGGAFADLLTLSSVNADGSPGTAGGTGTFTKVTGPDGLQIGDLRPDLAQVNELIDLPINNPAGAPSMQLRFRMFDAGNDWWWAVDNVQVYTGVPGPRDPTMKVVINRDTGAVTVTNGTKTAVQLRGYEISSTDGVFNEASATFLADSAPGEWRQLSKAGGVQDLSEGFLDSVGYSLTSGSIIGLGAGAWTPHFSEAGDVTFQYLVAGSDVPVKGFVEFVGNGGSSFAFLDLNFDGSVNIGDWETFLGVTTTADLSALSEAQAYRKGDLDGDLRLGLNDFIVFEREYDRINGVGSFMAVLSEVPEPTSVWLGVTAATLLATTRRPRRDATR